MDAEGDALAESHAVVAPGLLAQLTDFENIATDNNSINRSQCNIFQSLVVWHLLYCWCI